MAKNQKQIIHDLDVSLLVLNLTRSQVAENRRSIMDLIEVIQKLDVKILKIFDEIKQTTQDAIFYLDSLKSELNMLSMQHLSTNTISPGNLKELLIEIEMKLPNNFELPRNPRKEIWSFFKTLNCITYLESNEIRITLKIPLMNTKERYEVYKTYNLPVPLSKKKAKLLLKYDLETEMLMVSKDRAKFSLLSESTYHLCNTVKSRLSERQLSETTGLFEDDGQPRLFSLLSIAIKLLIIRISIIRKNSIFRSDSSVPMKEKLLKLPFKIRSPNVTHDDHDFFVWSSSI